MVKIVIEDASYPLDEKTKQIMEFVVESEAVEGAKEDFPINTISKEVFERILEVLKVAEYNFPEVAKVKGNDPKEYIGNNLTDFFTQLNCTYFIILDAQLNDLFKAAHFLKIKGLEMCIATFLACRVYQSRAWQEDGLF